MHNTDDHVGLYKVSGMSYVALVVVPYVNASWYVHSINIRNIEHLALGHYLFTHTSCSSGGFWGCMSDAPPGLGILTLIAKYLQTVQEVCKRIFIQCYAGYNPHLILS